MTGKTQDLYIRVFEELVGKMQDDGLHPNPLDVTLDFEKAIHNAVVDVFGGSTRVHGCFFHLRQSTWRQVQAAGLASRYNQDPEFAHQIRMIDALAYVPKNYVTEAFAEVKDVIPAEAAPVLEWFSTYYIHGSTRARRGPRAAATPPLFAVDVWNQFQLVIEGDRTTNNSLEAWHHHLQHVFGRIHHPSIYKFIKMIKPEQAVIEAEIAQAAAGIKKHKPKKNTIRNKQAMYDLCMDYHNRESAVDYLTAVAHRFKL